MPVVTVTESFSNALIVFCALFYVVLNIPWSTKLGALLLYIYTFQFQLQFRRVLLEPSSESKSAAKVTFFRRLTDVVSV